jgi:hypothetical protein
MLASRGASSSSSSSVTRCKVSKRFIHGGLLTLLLAVGLPLLSLRNAGNIASVAVPGGEDPGGVNQLRILGTGAGDKSSASSYSLLRNIRPGRQPPNISAHLVTRIPEMIRDGTYNGERIKVVSWPQWEVGASTAEAMHIDLNGIRESPYLEAASDFLDFDGSVVWLGDPGYGFGWSLWCGKFHELVVAARANRARLRRTLGLNVPLSWPIYIVDWSDKTNRPRCTDVEKAVGREFVFYSKRSIVTRRSWNNATDWVSVGHVMNTTDQRLGGATYRHIPLTVRTDIVKTMELVLQDQHNLTLRDPIERSIHRTIDVAHLWPLRRDGVDSQLRHAVSVFLTNFSISALPNLNIFVGTSGLTQHQGRRDVASDYVETLLESKIMVVTQRDKWEGEKLQTICGSQHGLAVRNLVRCHGHLYLWNPFGR